MTKLPKVNIDETGKKIRSLRIKAGLSVRQLQYELGFSTPQAIYKWESGRGLPSIDNLVVIAGVLGVTIDEIIVVETG